MKQLNSSWLIQRLNAPYSSKREKKIDLAFGGLGTITPQLQDITGSFFSLDYMGAAEYEFGEFSKQLKKIVELYCDEKIQFFEFVIPKGAIKDGWWRQDLIRSLRNAEIKEAKLRGEKPPRKNTKKLEQKLQITAKSDAPIGVIAPNYFSEVDLKQRIIDIFTGSVTGKNAYYGNVLDNLPDSGVHAKMIGAFEYDNGFIFFKDLDAYIKIRDEFFPMFAQ
jgi:hypothetical protein